MFKDKNILTIIALVCALLSLVAALFAIGAAGNQAQQVELLTREILRLSEQITELDEQKNETGLASWRLIPTAWADGTGADVAFTAVPEIYSAGMEVQLWVCLGQEVNAIRCTWNGTAFTATAEVPAADGYSYICVVNGVERTLVAASDPDFYILANLHSSLTSHCTLMVSGWEADEDTLTLTDAHVQVNLPRLSAGGEMPAVTSAALVMRLDTDEVDRKAVTLLTGEGEGSYELTLQNISFALPEMGQDDQVDLWLEVTLSDGQELVSASSGWYLGSNGLYLVAG